MNLTRKIICLCGILLFNGIVDSNGAEIILFGKARSGYTPTEYAKWDIMEEKSILLINIQKDSKVKNQTYGVNSIILPQNESAGNTVRITAEVKGEDIQEQKSNHRRARILLRYKQNEKIISRCSKGYYGTFDWRKLKLESFIPSDASDILVTIGLQNTTGKASFRNICIQKMDQNGPAKILAFGKKLPTPSSTDYAEWNDIGNEAILTVEYPMDIPPKDQTFGIVAVPVDVSSCMGKTIEISCMAKGEKIARQKYPNHSARILVRYNWNGKNVYKLSPGKTGTFNWEKLACELPIPLGVRKIDLSIGIQKTTGKAEFKNIRISEVKPKQLPQYSTVGEMRLTDLDWKLSSHVTRNGNILNVQVPAENGKNQRNAASAEFDISKMKGKSVTFSIQCKSENVTRPSKFWNGVKFMVLLQDASGKKITPGAMNLFGTFDWKTVHFTAKIPQTAAKGIFYLGLQDASGNVSFKLDSFQASDLSFRKQNHDWICEYSPEVRKRTPHRGVMIGNNLTKKDFEVLADWGCNLVRAQLVRKWGITDSDRDLNDYDKWIEKRLALLEKQLDWCDSYGIKMIIDLHNPPGGRNASFDFNLYHEAKFFNRFISLWEEIARRFKNKPALYGYDLINEPHQTSPARLYNYWDVQRIAAEKIRDIDPETPIYVASNDFNAASTYHYMSPLKLKNIIYQVHFYAPGSYTHQGLNNSWGVKGKNETLSYPGIIDGILYNKEQLKKLLEPVRNFAEQHKALIFCGEFSVIAWANGGERYLQDCIDLFEEFGWDWTYHAFREYSGWSVEHEWNGKKIVPAENTPRKKILLNAFRKNKNMNRKEQRTK